MATIFPDGWDSPEATGAIPFETATLRRLAAELPADYSIFHGIQWTRVEHGCSVYGELDFIVVAPRGQVVVIEQKNGELLETPEGLLKQYAARRKSVVLQMQRSIQSLQDRFRLAHKGVAMPLDYVLFCPDHRVLSPSTAGIAPERIIDAHKAGRLAERIVQIVEAVAPMPAVTAEVVRAFLADALDLAPDPSALVGHARKVVTRLSDGLATWARRLEFEPFRLRVIGTAGSGKTQLALRVLEDAAAVGERALYVCYNRPLADHLRTIAPPTAKVATFHMLADEYRRERGVPANFSDPGAFEGMTTAFVAAETDPAATFDVLMLMRE